MLEGEEEHRVRSDTKTQFVSFVLKGERQLQKRFLKLLKKFSGKSRAYASLPQPQTPWTLDPLGKAG